GGAEPAFRSTEEASTVLGTIMGRHNEIVRALDAAPDDFDPVFWEGEDGQAIVTDWAAGFLDAVMLRPKAWEPLVRHSEASALMTPLLVLGAEDPERLPFGVRPPPKEQVEALHAIGADLIPDCVVGIHGFWRERCARAAGMGNGGGRPAGSAAVRRRRR
ncbi:MAG: YecA family protein, partial [Acetobacteraceae bacterium]|nr:YecA family protein [Acetobacteraceae bacterium]